MCREKTQNKPQTRQAMNTAHVKTGGNLKGWVDAAATSRLQICSNFMANASARKNKFRF
jgi:hypothetical protein